MRGDYKVTQVSHKLIPFNIPIERTSEPGSGAEIRALLRLFSDPSANSTADYVKKALTASIRSKMSTAAPLQGIAAECGY
jgi:hypothetical protein